MARYASYELLPSSGDVSLGDPNTRIKRPWRHYLALLRRPRVLILVTLIVLLIGSTAAALAVRRVRWRVLAPFHEMPSLYPEWREAERRLPQHNKDLPFPEGESGRRPFVPR
jgi:hypothetical protein